VCARSAVVLLLLRATHTIRDMLTLRLFQSSSRVCQRCWDAAAVTAQALPDPPSRLSAPIEFYLARGEPDACGRGCNEWIAAEGKIDASAAQRLRQLLAKLGRSRPPDLLPSPAPDPGLARARPVIREQKKVVSVGHTIHRLRSRHAARKSCEAQRPPGQDAPGGFRSEYHIAIRAAHGR